MKNFEQKLIASRPETSKSNHVFTEKVMRNLNKKSSIRTRVLSFAFQKPAFAVLSALLVIGVVGGTTYAVSYLWPKSTVTLQGSSTQNGHTVMNVFADNCGPTAHKRYGVTPRSKINVTDAPKIVAAGCNFDALQAWAFEQYPSIRESNSSIGSQLPNKAGTVVHDVQTPSGPSLSVVTAISAQSVTMSNQSQTTTYQITPATTFVVDHRYTTWDKIKPGDAVATITRDTATMTADPDCNETNCHYSLSDEKRELLSVVTLDEPIEFYSTQLRGQIYEIAQCENSPADDCIVPNGGAQFDLYTASVMGDDPNVPHGNGISAPMTDQDALVSLQGRLVSSSDSQMVIKTTSDRMVTLPTPSDIVTAFNMRKQGYSMSTGDLISVDYSASKTALDTIASNRIYSIRLMLSTSGKGVNDFTRY